MNYTNNNNNNNIIRNNNNNNNIRNINNKKGNEYIQELPKVLYDYPYIFHKYLLGVNSYNNPISYNIIKVNQNNKYKNNKIFAHLHCYNIDDFNDIYGDYIENIKLYYSIILTYSLGTQLPNTNIVILKIPNVGMDIGAKIICLDYLNKNNIDYDYLLFLHSKKDKTKRKIYYDPFISSKKQIHYIVSIMYHYDLIVPDLMLHGDWNKGNQYKINEKYYKEMNKFLNLQHKTYNHFEGNVVLASKRLIEKIYNPKYLQLFYNILNTEGSFDYNWVNIYYKFFKNDIKYVFKYYLKYSILPNHLVKNDKPLIKDFNKIFDKEPIYKDYFLKDGAIEHLWERLWYNTLLNINGKYKIINENLIMKPLKLKYEFDTNLYRLLNNDPNYDNSIDNIETNIKPFLESQEKNKILHLYSLEQILEHLPLDFDIEKYSNDTNLLHYNKYELINHYILKNQNSEELSWKTKYKDTINVTNIDFKEKCKKTFVIVFPQFHEIPENNYFWGKGFTEWSNVKKTKQIHHKHLPIHPHRDIGYYDILNEDVSKRWNTYASEYGFDGFIYYHYWFSHGSVMDKPLKQIINNESHNKPWFLIWVNENWTKRWDGGNNEVLLEIKINEKQCEKHANVLLEYFKHINYYKVNNKPLLGVYRSKEIPNSYIKKLNSIVRDYGFEEIIFIDILNNDIPSKNNVNKNYYCSMELEFPPNYSGSLVKSHGTYKKSVNYKKNMESIKQHNFNYNINEHYKGLTKTKPVNKTLLRGVMPCWDNYPRHTTNKSNHHIQLDSNSFIFYLMLLKQYILLEKDNTYFNSINENGKGFLVINSLNEWGEQCTLEPSIQYEYSFLKAIQLARKTNLNIINEDLLDKLLNYK